MTVSIVTAIVTLRTLISVSRAASSLGSGCDMHAQKQEGARHSTRCARGAAHLARDAGLFQQQLRVRTELLVDARPQRAQALAAGLDLVLHARRVFACGLTRT